MQKIASITPTVELEGFVMKLKEVYFYKGRILISSYSTNLAKAMDDFGEATLRRVNIMIEEDISWDEEISKEYEF